MPDKQLILIRHAKSSWDDIELDDHERPLNDRGERNGPMMGQRLKKLGVNPDKVFTSSAVRAVSTAQIVCEEIEFPREYIIPRRVLYHADVSTWSEFISELDDSWNAVMIFGHNPGLTELAIDIWQLSVSNVPTCGVLLLGFDAGSWEKVFFSQPVRACFDYPKNKSGLPEVLR
ncbi:MAG: histidine phosphatase family protein [Verrucomicrobiota bacterium]|jgi:phosphohistidine phosphatase|nr:histidine phosphatase family protein [Verrucomicrobiota bacterium]